jgi:hypothetical protein
MSVVKILGWGECTSKFTPASGGSAETHDDIVINSASLSVEEGQEDEAQVEGGRAEGRKVQPDKYIIEFDRRLGSTSEFTPGYEENAGDIAIIPKNVGAVYAELKNCSCKKTLKQGSTDGLVGHYLYKTKGSTDSNGDLDDIEIKQHSQNETYTAVSTSLDGYSTKNPKTLGWFIKNGNTYIHSYDTTPVEGVTYYTLS